MYQYIIIHIIRWSPGSLALLCRWRVRFSVRRSWLFFDISILSRRPFCNLCNRCRIEPVARSQRGQPVNPGHRPDVVPRARLMQRVRSGLREWSLPPSPGNLETLNISFFGAVWCALVRFSAVWCSRVDFTRRRPEHLARFLLKLYPLKNRKGKETVILLH